ncbi:HalOD1 output domain-containing protein (plasmid) [Haloarcula salina]|uniref:HalOD1 output domain-containing protein n=1 Tax=Haloarcula salina TaxID=1429914 RepID=UPI003C702751
MKTPPNPGDRRLVYRTELSLDSDTAVSREIVEAISDAADCDPVELPPFQHVVDVDALNALFSAETLDRTGRRLCFTFEYANYDVSVFGDGTIEVYR